MLGLLKDTLLMQIVSIAGLGAILDMLLDANSKSRLSEFIFAPSARRLPEFEFMVISALLSLFMTRADTDRISWLRVFVYSYTFCLILVPLSVLGMMEAPIGQVVEGLLAGPVLVLAEVIAILASLALVIALFCFVLDLGTLYVTKRVYFYKVYSGRGIARAIATDLAIKAILFLAALFVVAIYSYALGGFNICFDVEEGIECPATIYALSAYDNDIFDWQDFLMPATFVIAIYYSILSAAMLTVFTYCALLAGLLLRMLSRIEWLQTIIANDFLRQNPMFAVFLVTAIVSAAMEAGFGTLSWFWTTGFVGFVITTQEQFLPLVLTYGIMAVAFGIIFAGAALTVRYLDRRDHGNAKD